MTNIDERLLDPNGKPEIIENFSRVLNLLDEAEYTPGVQGPQGVGFQGITSTIGGANKLTLPFTLTDESTKIVEGQITPPAAG